ncbi:MAG TPA: TetR/AcrR family transcriptional regulator [Thermoanaerobaculia bacterium]|nr:TetR/AcrR family transcriptional regulator [Thermoanaerobaculia bacterium]
MAEHSLAVTAPTLWQSHKRQSIQEAVIQLLCREGLQSVTMERVAQEVGIAKGTVYLHYRDKQELLDAVKEAVFAPLMTKMAGVVDSDLPPDRKLRAWAQCYLAFFDERRDLFRVLLYERAVVRVQGSRYKAGRYKELVAGAEGVIADGIEARLFREVPAQKAAAMFVESNIAMMNHRLLATGQSPVEEDADLITEVFLRGFAAEKPAKRATRARALIAKVSGTAIARGDAAAQPHIKRGRRA